MPTTPSARRKARKLLVQALYQWQLTGTPSTEIEAQFHVDNDMAPVDTEFFSKVLNGIAREKAALQKAIEPYLDRGFHELDPVSLSVLRMGFFELQHCVDVPYKVVINESVNLAKTFGATDSFKYVNGVLDKAAAKYRMAEARAK